MNLFALAGLSCGLFAAFLAFLALFYGKAKIHRILTYFNISVSIWGFGGFFVGLSSSESSALLSWRFAQMGGIFVAIFFYHLICLFCNLRRSFITTFFYIVGLFFLFFCFFTDYLFRSTRSFHGVYYNKATLLYVILIYCWLSIVILSFIELIRYYFTVKATRRLHARYMIVGFLVGFVGGTSILLPMVGINFPPYGSFAIPLYCIISSYAILKYRLLDLSIVVTRTGIFIAVYSLVLGIPFALAFGWQKQLMALFGDHWWLAPLISSTVLATAGPFIYLFIQKRAENRLLQEQKRYQSTLRQASSGMGKIKDLKKLVNLIVHIVTRTVHIEHSSVYLYGNEEKKYFLGASRNRKVNTNGVLDADSPLIAYLKEVKEPIVYEEIKQRTQDYSDAKLARIETSLRDLDAAVAVPSFVEERLLAIIILGKKLSGKLYSDDDLAVFQILANQAALAIENAQFYEDVKRTQEQLFQAEKMATIGTMADGLSHQINNRLHALGFIAGDALDTIKLKISAESPADIKEVIKEIEKALVRIQDNVKQGGEIVQGLLKYTRKGEAGFSPVDFDQLITASFEMASYKVKLDQITVVRDYPADLPKILGNFTQLQEVFFNLIDNAYDATVQRKNEKSEAGYKGKLTISVKIIGDLNADNRRSNADGRKLEGKDNLRESALDLRKSAFNNILNPKIEISVTDNGIGVKEEDQDKLFTPFFTTKLSSKKGTGLGLYVIQKIIEENHGGKVTVSSEYMTGTLFTIVLPIAA